MTCAAWYISGESLEISHKIQTIVFDKTGTITEGKPKVTDVVTVNEVGIGSIINEDELIKFAK